MYLSKYSDVVSITDYKATARRRRHLSESRNRPPTFPKEVDNRLRHLMGEFPEKILFQTLHETLGRLKHDCLILANQKLVHPHTLQTFERDFIIVDLTARFVMNIEVKSVLTKFSISASQRGGAKRQLRISKWILKELFGGKISKDWKFVAALYGRAMDQNLWYCGGCEPYVMYGRNVFQKLERAIPNVPFKKICDSTWIEEFKMISKTLIFHGVQIEDDIINKICAKIDSAGTPKNIAFWSPEQYDILDSDIKRILLMSPNSTGKTILMLYKVKELLNQNESVVFLIYQHHKRERKSLLQMKIEEDFKFYIKKKKLFVDTITGNYSYLTLEKYKYYHLFVDELLILYEPEWNDEKWKQHTEIVLNNWHVQHEKTKFLWITISGIDERIKYESFFKAEHEFWMPQLNFPLRNAVEILTQAEAYQTNSNRNGFLSDLDVGLEGHSLKTFWSLDIPDNLSNTLAPIIRFRPRASDVLQIGFNEIKRKSEREKPFALVILATQLTQDLKNPNTNANEIITKIFLKANRPQPYFHSYLDESKEFTEEQIKIWITRPNLRFRDLVVDYTTSHGCENDIVIFLQRKGQAIIPNSLLRAKSLLAILTFHELS